MRFYALLVGSFVALAAISASSIALAPGSRHPLPAAVVARCGDFVEITRGVFTGREGAYFTVHGVRAFLGGGTFGPMRCKSMESTRQFTSKRNVDSSQAEAGSAIPALDNGACGSCSRRCPLKLASCSDQSQPSGPVMPACESDLYFDS